jgi:hypothetical protein
MKRNPRVILALILSAFALHLRAAAQPPRGLPQWVPYTWKSVRIVGGGFVDGIVFHPTEKGRRTRTWIRLWRSSGTTELRVTDHMW